MKKLLLATCAVVLALAGVLVGSPAPSAQAISGSWADIDTGGFSNIDEVNNIVHLTSAEDLGYLDCIMNGNCSDTDNDGSSFNNDSYMYILDADIDMSAHYYNTPTSDLYDVTFDGNGHTISGLTYERGANCVGLFSLIQGSTIKNLTLQATYEATGDLNGSVFMGLLVGYVAEGTTISNVHTSGSITLSNLASQTTFYAGGLVGFSDGAYINRSSADVAISVTGYNSDFSMNLGGLVARIDTPTVITNSYALGSITANVTTDGWIMAGGILGDDEGISIVVNNYSRTPINIQGEIEHIRIGGVVQNIGGDTFNNYHTGALAGDSNIGGEVFVGGVAGYLYDNDVRYNYYQISDTADAVGLDYGGLSNLYGTTSFDGSAHDWDLAAVSDFGQSKLLAALNAYVAANPSLTATPGSIWWASSDYTVALDAWTYGACNQYDYPVFVWQADDSVCTDDQPGGNQPGGGSVVPGVPKTGYATEVKSTETWASLVVVLFATLATIVACKMARREI
jgi:hypothetical protein